MNTKHFLLCGALLSLSFGLSACGNAPAVTSIAIGDTASVKALSQNLSVTSDFGRHYDIFTGRPAAIRPTQTDLLWGDHSFPSEVSFMGLSGRMISFSCHTGGFTIADETGVLYQSESVSGITEYVAYSLTTSNPNKRLWLIKGPALSPTSLWILEETESNFTKVADPADFAKAGIAIEKQGSERLDIHVENGALAITKYHISKVESDKDKQSVKWSADKTVYIDCPKGGDSFALLSSPEKKSGASASFLSGFTNPSLKIESFGKSQRLYGFRPSLQNPDSCATLTMSNGKKLRLAAYMHFFRILDEEGNVYFTSDTCRTLGARFTVTEVNVSDAKTRVWQVRYDGAGNQRAESGYWLLGERDGIFSVYLTPQDLETAGIPLPDTQDGFSAKGAHYLNLRVLDGVIKGEYIYVFIPGNAKPADKKHLLDKTFTIAWDKSAGTFIIRDVKDEAPAYLEYDADKKESKWIPMTEEEARKLTYATFSQTYH